MVEKSNKVLNIGFWFNWGATLYLNDVAKHLSSTRPNFRFSGIVTGKTHYEYLMNQKEVNYTNLLLEEDIILGSKMQKISKKHKYYRQHHLVNDRIFGYKYQVSSAICTKRRILIDYNLDLDSIISYCEIVFEKYIIDSKIDYFYFNTISSLFHSLFYEVLIANNVSVFVSGHTRIKNYVSFFRSNKLVFSNIENDFEVRKFYPNEIKSKAIKILSDFRTLKPKPDYMAVNNAQVFRHLSFRSVMYNFKSYYYNKRAYSISPIPFYSEYFKNIFYNLRIKRKLLSKINELVKPFIFFPLHVNPESSTAGYAPLLDNQLFVIELLSKSIPCDNLLVVKDHYPMFGFRNRKFLKALLDLPNVILADSNMQSLELIMRSELTITITGTAGFEALMLGKKSLSFAEPFYRKLHPKSYISNNYNLRSIITETLEEPLKISEDKKLEWLCATIMNSYQVDSKNLFGLNKSTQKTNDYKKFIINFSEFLLKEIYIN